jgi:hypothetical protein
MMFLIIINLAFIIFDWNFNYAFFQHFLARVSPSFFAYYRDEVHPNFIVYDLFFVTLYVLELVASWAVAIKRETYDRWYYYPLMKWYDVLGCIPVGTFRWLRILRVFSILYRLHRLEVIDLSQTHLYKEGNRLYKMVMEEISDKVVLKILTGIENEIKADSPVSTQMVSQILKPHQEALAKWLSHRIKTVVEHNYMLYKDDLKNYIEDSIGGAIKHNKEVQRIGLIPIVGKQITNGLEHGVSNITYEAINGLVKGMSTEESAKVIEDAIHAMFESMLMQEEDKELNGMIKDIFIRAIELVKDQVKIKRWKENGVQPKLAMTGT